MAEATDGRLRYTGDPGGSTVGTAFRFSICVIFGALGLFAVIGGALHGVWGPVVYGGALLVVTGVLSWWNLVHLVDHLELDGATLRGAAPLRAGEVPLADIRCIRPPARRASIELEVVIELAGGRRLRVEGRPELLVFVHGLEAANPGLDVDLGGLERHRHHLAEWEDRVVRRRALRVGLTVVVTAVFVVFFGAFTLAVIAPNQDFSTLRADLDAVELPAGYVLFATHRTGSDCHHSCELDEYWVWRGPPRAAGRACADSAAALRAATGAVNATTPVPASAACSYDATLRSVLHAGEGRRTLAAVVLTRGTYVPAGHSFLVELSDAYA